jgi:hypothetical protein
MNIFHCGQCQRIVFFENTSCIGCGGTLAFLPDLREISTLEPVGAGLWRSVSPGTSGQLYRLCGNYLGHSVCNWAVLADDPYVLCVSCRLTRVIPDLDRPGHKAAWHKLEQAKRRLVYGLMTLGCPLENRIDDPQRGLAFEFLADPDTPGSPPILTGHAGGVITLNVAEADDVERERRRLLLREPYRTLLGHLRHESGHYYWERLIAGGPRLEAFRDQFGDERLDYAEALHRHYEQGPPPDWQQRCVSAYASSHPWEDWAETWAHYLHLIEVLETAAAWGVTMHPRRPGEPILPAPPPMPRVSEATPFDQLLDCWFPLTALINDLNRGLGQPDAYPFALSSRAVDKLRFVHETLFAPP